MITKRIQYRRVAPVESLWTLLGRRSRKRFVRGWACGERTCATQRANRQVYALRFDPAAAALKPLEPATPSPTGPRPACAEWLRTPPVSCAAASAGRQSVVSTGA